MKGIINMEFEGKHVKTNGENITSEHLARGIYVLAQIAKKYDIKRNKAVEIILMAYEETCGETSELVVKFEKEGK
ncbi:hypothetical protein [Clostridium kluyveri]|uniref:hypothetical protein n=1 Tax=Clostridium kluyveri TaxID=1534 RepID=UPI0022457812|nr:hypothetical protein [Clostridium kluyveri]UZQ49819.1 hypothetical protein OP486_18010 [Clostridium kluyveri]